MISMLHSVAALLAGVLLHPVHETYCEMQWNAQSHCVEVALRLHALDEQWIEREFKTEYSTPISAKNASGQGAVEQRASEQGAAEQKASTEQKAPVWQVRFLADHLVFDPPAKRQQSEVLSPASLRWVGRKQDGAHAWWFFEVKRKDGEKPRRIQSRLLFQRHGDYRHRLVVLDQEGKAKAEAIELHREMAQSPIDL